MPTKHRYLEAVRQLPVNPPDHVLEAFLNDWNDELGEGSFAKEMSNLRTFRSARVDEQWDDIWHAAEADHADEPDVRFAEHFRRNAAAVRDGFPLSPPKPQPQRRIVQIAAIPGDDRAADCVYALADDGTLWFGEHNSYGISKWRPLPELPQPGDTT